MTMKPNTRTRRNPRIAFAIFPGAPLVFIAAWLLIEWVRS